MSVEVSLITVLFNFSPLFLYLTIRISYILKEMYFIRKLCNLDSPTFWRILLHYIIFNF